MRINEKFSIQVLNGHTVIIDSQSGKACGEVDFNEIKMFLWDLAKEGEITKQEMLNGVLNKFEISTVLALGEIDTFIKKLKEYGINK
ncbi:MAG: hypothetical protein J6B80_04200 [Clostridia bacterium]|nr:hypothetical protein [Clostridia bacterium]